MAIDKKQLPMTRLEQDDAKAASMQKCDKPHHLLIDYALSLPLGPERDEAMKKALEHMDMLEAPIKVVVRKKDPHPTKEMLEQNKRFQELLNPPKKKDIF